MTERLSTGEQVEQAVLPDLELPEIGLLAPVNVFIVSKLGHEATRRVLWRVTKEDAIKVCTDPRTAGENHALHWTGVDIDDPKVNTFVEDNGMYDAVLAEHEVRVLDCARYQESA